MVLSSPVGSPFMGEGREMTMLGEASDAAEQLGSFLAQCQTGDDANCLSGPSVRPLDSWWEQEAPQRLSIETIPGEELGTVLPAL